MDLDRLSYFDQTPRGLRALASLSAMVLVTACGGGGTRDEMMPPGTSGNDSITTAGDDDGTTGGDETGGATSDPSADGSGDGPTGDGGTDGEVCETEQCGLECCAVDQECVLSECRAICESGVRCGDDLEVCCDEGNVCAGGSCVVPGDPCLDPYDCPEGEFCEPTIDACLPQQEPVDCEVEPNFQDVEVAEEWSFTQMQFSTVPLVGDVTGDGRPEVVATTSCFNETNAPTDCPVGSAPCDGDVSSMGFNCHSYGNIKIIDGTTGQVEATVLHRPAQNEYGAYGRSTPGLANIDGDEIPDIVYAGRPTVGQGADALNKSLIHAVNGIGANLWSPPFSHDESNQPYYVAVRFGAPAFANLDDDPEAEIAYGGTIIDDDGLVVWDFCLNSDNNPDIATNCDWPTPNALPSGSWGPDYDRDWGGGALGSPDISNSFPVGGLPVFADIDPDDPGPELITGRHAYRIDWDDPAIGFPDVTLTEMWDAGAPDGYPQVADLDGNGTPEVVIVGDDQFKIVDGRTGNLWCGVDADGSTCQFNDAARTQPVTVPGGGSNGPAVIADFDDDGRPEIGLSQAGGNVSSFLVYDLNRNGEVVVQPEGASPPLPGQAFIRWSADSIDITGNGTGSAVFDFQGDGAAEVLFADQCQMRVLDGSTGSEVFALNNSSQTFREYPVVADVDGDGNTELMLVANLPNTVQNPCTELDPNYEYRQGIFLYGDPNDQWVRTRRVWNQHTYHVTNADARGAIPETETNHWEVEGLNSFRQNVQGTGVFNAPNLAVDLSVGLSTCLDEEFELIATVRNEGSLGVPAGVDVSLYEGTSASGEFIGTKTTEVALLPGSFTRLVWQVPAPGGEAKTFYVAIDGADQDDPEAGIVNECIEDDNSATTETVSCPIPG